MKICPVEAKLFHADRHDEANSRISQFCERALKSDTFWSPAFFFFFVVLKLGHFGQ